MVIRPGLLDVFFAGGSESLQGLNSLLKTPVIPPVYHTLYSSDAIGCILIGFCVSLLLRTRYLHGNCFVNGSGSYVVGQL